MAPNAHSPWITIHKWNSPISLRNKRLEQEKSQRSTINHNTKELRPFQPRVNDPVKMIDVELSKLREAPSKVKLV
jgi:hypothetical protein